MNKHDPIVGRYVYVTCQGKTYRTIMKRMAMESPSCACIPQGLTAVCIGINFAIKI